MILCQGEAEGLMLISPKPKVKFLRMLSPRRRLTVLADVPVRLTDKSAENQKFLIKKMLKK